MLVCCILACVVNIHVCVCVCVSVCYVQSTSLVIETTDMLLRHYL